MFKCHVQHFHDCWIGLLTILSVVQDLNVQNVRGTHIKSWQLITVLLGSLFQSYLSKESWQWGTGHENESEFGQEECKRSPGTQSYDRMLWLHKKKKATEGPKAQKVPFNTSQPLGYDKGQRTTSASMSFTAEIKRPMQNHQGTHLSQHSLVPHSRIFCKWMLKATNKTS